MANPEHLRILRQGVEVWNRWRQENPSIRPNLFDARLPEVDLCRANLSEANLIQIQLPGAKLTNAHFLGAVLRGAILTGATLSEANLNSADLAQVYLEDTDLTCAGLTYANLTSARLNRANLSGGVLYLTNLNGAQMGETNLSSCMMQGTLLADVDLSTAKGLDRIIHAGPSTIGIDTIYRSKGNIPEVFLRGAGVPDQFIEYARSLVGQAIEYHSCFISYSSKDQGLAERLHADLQSRGVRCWYAPQDMKIGDKIRPAIDRAIHLQDKLLLILSESSIASQRVEDEVEAALERERQENPLVIFPIRIDDAVMEENVGWAAHLKGARHIGDFRQWKNHDAYQKAFERLIRDLNTSSS